MKTDIPQEKLRETLNEIREFLKKDGGDMRIVEIKDDTAIVQFLGNCMHCHIKNISLNLGIKAIFQKHLPQIKNIIEYQ